jgi:hypothetical protein
MTVTCYHVWSAVPRGIVRHIGHRIARHGVRHATLATVRIVCVTIPAWLAAPAPAVAPYVPMVLPPPILPWPGDQVPWQWGTGDLEPAYGNMPSLPSLPPAYPQGADMPALPPSDAPPVDMPALVFPVTVIALPDLPHQPVPEPSGAVVLAIGILVLLKLKAMKNV